MNLTSIEDAEKAGFKIKVVKLKYATSYQAWRPGEVYFGYFSKLQEALDTCASYLGITKRVIDKK